MNQTKLEVNTCSLHKARENVRGTNGFVFYFWLDEKVARVFFKANHVA